jgi:hypothetical protein
MGKSRPFWPRLSLLALVLTVNVGGLLVWFYVFVWELVGAGMVSNLKPLLAGVMFAVSVLATGVPLLLLTYMVVTVAENIWHGRPIFSSTEPDDQS